MLLLFTTPNGRRRTDDGCKIHVDKAYMCVHIINVESSSLATMIYLSNPGGPAAPSPPAYSFGASCRLFHQRLTVEGHMRHQLWETKTRGKINVDCL